MRVNYYMMFIAKLLFYKKPKIQIQFRTIYGIFILQNKCFFCIFHVYQTLACILLNNIEYLKILNKRGKRGDRGKKG